jgi:hypothetical protein
MRPQLRFAVALLILTVAAPAGVIVYTIPDIGTFPGYTNPNTADTYSGTGFVGLYGVESGNPPSFVHLFGLESTDYSRVILQVGISALTGSTINSAVLTFKTLDEHDVQTVTATSFTANGTLGFYYTPPDNLGTVGFSTLAQDDQSVDVTGLLSARVGAGAGWFGLHLVGTTEEVYPYTYTFPVYGGTPDSAMVRLTVDYTSAIPEPGTLVLLGAGLLLVAGLRLRRR